MSGDALHFVVRDEAPADIAAIDAVTRAAFLDHPFSQQTEHRIVHGLRDAGALALSLVALDGRGEVFGHVAASPVTIDGRSLHWMGLGPVSVSPPRQRLGVGSALIRSTLRRLRDQGAAGCVVLGDPAYYTRFGFAPQAGLTFVESPPEHFMALAFAGTAPQGAVRYHDAFDAAPA
jgi:putative acetyltransferase